MTTKPDALFVVPTKFDPNRPVIYECITAIQDYHVHPDILIVDSGSDDKSYMGWCRDRGCIVADIDNQRYAHGAFGWAYREHPASFYYLMFDSLIVQGNLDHLTDEPLTVTRHWPSSMHDWGWDERGEHLSIWGGQQLDRMGIPRTSSYTGIMGPMMFAQRLVLDQLDAIGYWDIEVTSSYLHCALERVAGIALEFLGYDPAEVSLQGVHTHHEAKYDESLVAKRNMGRL